MPRPRRKPAKKAIKAVIVGITAPKETSILPSSLNIEIVYVPEQISDPLFDSHFQALAEKFIITDSPAVNLVDSYQAKVDLSETNEDDNNSDDPDNNSKLSHKKERLLNRLSVAQLKQLVKKPDVVDWVDVTATDPKLLVHLKSYRNTVPVPSHWSQKRKYLQAKRGFLKKPFELPDFIKQTGITEMRGDVNAAQKINTRYIKTGRSDIDYQKLHDAFFRLQKKPKNITLHGDLYYEGKEYEASVRTKRPGELSDELQAALNMPPNAPPPWLINMQRFGPPPSYPHLRIPGLNAPIPEGAQWGFHPGGWGKPPVDDFNRPLYGDVFTAVKAKASKQSALADKKLWGEIESDHELESESEEENEEDEDQEAAPLQLEFTAQEQILAIESYESSRNDGLVTPSGMASVPSGIETPDVIQLKKDRAGPKSLYKVIPQREKMVDGFMGSQHIYDVGEAVDISLDASEVEHLDEDLLRKKLAEQSSTNSIKKRHEDLSGMVQDHANKKQKKGYKF